MKYLLTSFVLMLLLSPVKATDIDLTKPHELWVDSTQSSVKSLPNLPQSKIVSNKSVATEGPFTSHQVNVNSAGNNVLNDAGNEPSIAVNPLNPKQIAIGWRQFNNTNSDFRQAGLAYSSDGGISWNNIGPLEPGKFRSDPVLAADADGTFFYQSLAVESAGEPGLDDDIFRVDQWQSIDGGQTWGNKVNAIGGDKSWFDINRSNTPERGHIYAAWNLAGNNHYPDSFNYSVDNGQNWSSPESLPKSPIYGTVAVGFDGTVYVAGVYGETNLNDLYVIKSNNTLSGIFPDFNQVTGINLGGAVAVGGINPVGLLGQVWIATDKSNRHTRGNVYVAASVDRFGNDPLDINFIRSRDDALSFSTPKKINDDNSQNDWQWFGTMGVAPNGRIDLIWLDTRNTVGSLAGKNRSELFYSYSYDGGLSFSKNQSVSPDFNHYLGYPVQQKMGDYIDIVSDNTGAHIAYTATFTGGQDVYYLHAKPAAMEENPYFPSHEMDGAWHHPDVPRQGIISKTMVADFDTSKLINFEAVFTETPTGVPTWFVLQALHPLTADFIDYVVYFPTGDLSEEGVAVRPIGLVKKSRIYDEEGELIKNKLHYQFDMSETIMTQVMAEANNFDPAFYQSNPFYQTTLSIELEPLLAPEQNRNIHCLTHNLVLENPLEKNEGRVSTTYRSGIEAHLFMADFTYEKSTDINGNQTLITDENGLATPTWQTMNTVDGDLLVDPSITTEIYRPNGGNGFFNANTEDPGVALVGTETLTLDTNNVLTSVDNQGATEQLNALALNSYCGNQGLQ